MFKRKNIIALLLVVFLVLPSAMASAAELGMEAQEGLLDDGLSIPNRDASSWALDELVDSDRYGLYDTKALYSSSLKQGLSDDFQDMLLANFKEKLEAAKLERVEKPEFQAEVVNRKTRGGFLRELYNILIDFETKENLGKDPIMYLNHLNIVSGNGHELFLDRNVSTEEAILFAKRSIDYIYTNNQVDSQGLMWKVQNKGNTVYLLGSIHYGETDMYPLREGIINNFDSSEKLYVEVDITDQEAMMKAMVEKIAELEKDMEESGKYQDGTSLKSVIDEELYSRIETIMDKHNISKEEYENLKISGLEQKLNELIFQKAMEDMDLEDMELSPEEQAEMDKAMEESMAEMADDPFMNLLLEGPKLGIDFYFLDKAKSLNKDIGELESMESQMDLLFGGELFENLQGNLSEEEQLENLKETLKNFDQEGNIVEVEMEEPEIDLEFDENFEEEIDQLFDEQVKMINAMFDSVKTGDAEKLAELFSESEGDDIFAGQLLGERDKNMAIKIKDLLEGEGEKTYFIVVGAAHFVVDGTIIDHLIDMGYEVERL